MPASPAGADGRLTAPSAHERPLLGYGLVAAAALLAAVNGTLGKIVMESGDLSALRVSEVRATGAALLLLVGIVLLHRSQVRPSRREILFLALFGLVGLALAPYLYFASIERLYIGVALLIVNFAIVLVALWSRLYGGEAVHARLWAAIVLTLAGLALVVKLWEGLAFDALGIATALAAALVYAAYILLSDRGVRSGRPPSFLIAWGFVFAALFWAAVQPWWSFPTDLVTNDVSLLGRLDASSGPVWLLLAYMIPFGTVAPFILVTSAFRFLPATHVVVANVLEPVFGAAVAFAWLNERLGPVQIVGGVLVLTGVVIAQTARTSQVRRRAERLEQGHECGRVRAEA